jgi:hypothetical protein
MWFYSGSCLCTQVPVCARNNAQSGTIFHQQSWNVAIWPWKCLHDLKFNKQNWWVTAFSSFYFSLNLTPNWSSGQKTFPLWLIIVVNYKAVWLFFCWTKWQSMRSLLSYVESFCQLYLYIRMTIIVHWLWNELVSKVEFKVFVIDGKSFYFIPVIRLFKAMAVTGKHKWFNFQFNFSSIQLLFKV